MFDKKLNEYLILIQTRIEKFLVIKEINEIIL
jgi:hypothetical protein